MDRRNRVCGAFVKIFIGRFRALAVKTSAAVYNKLFFANAGNSIEHFLLPPFDIFALRADGVLFVPQLPGENRRVVPVPVEENFEAVEIKIFPLLGGKVFVHAFEFAVVGGAREGV